MLDKGAVRKMVRLAILLCVVFALLILGTVSASAAPRVLLDGTQLSFDVPPVIEQGRTLVPLRGIFEALGADVQWDGATRTVTATRGQTTIRLTIGLKTAYKNGVPVTLDVPAKIINDRTLVPLRFVSESLDCRVDWDAKTQTVTITSASGAQVKVHLIDVSQGDSIYIQLPNRNDILIDGGDNAYGSVVVGYLRNQDVDDIELVIATHPHADHIGGLDDVLTAFDVELVIDSGMPADTATYRDYLAAVRAEGCRHEKAQAQTWTFGSCVFEILGPARDYGDANNNSVVCLLDCGDVEFLFTGDAEVKAEADLLSKSIAAEILKVGHHGSRTSTSQAFLDAVSPEVAVVSVGAGNRYGHPHRETLERLSAAGVKVYRTDLNGTVTVLTDGRTYTVSAERSGAVAPPEQPAVTGKYVGSVKSNKYHLPTCRYAEAIAPENRIWFDSEAEARAAGYEPCKVCNP